MSASELDWDESNEEEICERCGGEIYRYVGHYVGLHCCIKELHERLLDLEQIVAAQRAEINVLSALAANKPLSPGK